MGCLLNGALGRKFVFNWIGDVHLIEGGVNLAAEVLDLGEVVCEAGVHDFVNLSVVN